MSSIYNPQNPAPIVVNGITYSYGACDDINPITGAECVIGIFQYSSTDGWDKFYWSSEFSPGTDLLTDIATHGPDMNSYIQYQVDLLNAVNVSENLGAPAFSVPVVPATPAPATYQEAIAAIAAALATGSFAGTQIPAQLVADYASGFASIPIGSDVPNVWGGVMYRFSQNVINFYSPDGLIIALTPKSDLGALAKNFPSIAAAFKTDYGWTPQ